MTEPNQWDSKTTVAGRALEAMKYQVHLCTECDMEQTPNMEEEESIELKPGQCPVHDRPCEYGCEMECFLDDMTERELANFDLSVAQGEHP